MKKSILISILTFFSFASFAQKSAESLPESKYTEFIPISPVEFGEDIETYDESGTVNGAILDLWQAKQFDALRHFINDINSYTTISLTDNSGQINYLINSFSSKNNTYNINADWLQCRVVEVYNDTAKIGELLIGVGIRISGSITTKEKNLNLSQIFSGGLTINSKKTKGQIKVNVIGLESKEITALTPVLNELTTTSIQEAIKTMATIRAKIYDSGTSVYPKIVAVKKMDPNYMISQRQIVQQFINNIQSGANLLAPGR